MFTTVFTTGVTSLANRRVHYRIHNRCYKLHPSHHSSSDHSNTVRWTEQTTQLLAVQPSPSARHFHPVTPKYFPLTDDDGQAPVLHCNVPGSWPPHSHTQLQCCNSLRNLFQLPTYRSAPLRIPTSTPVLWRTQNRHCRISSKVSISKLRRHTIQTVVSCMAMQKTVNCTQCGPKVPGLRQ